MEDLDKLILSVFEEGKGLTAKGVIEKLDELGVGEHNNIHKKLVGLGKFRFIERVPSTRPTVWVLSGTDYSSIAIPEFKPEKTLYARSKECGIPYSTVRSRIKRGWSEEEALNITPKKCNVSDSLYAKCKKHGMNYGTVRDRIVKMGWDEEKALTTPSRKDKSNSLYYKCKEHGLPYSTVYFRIKKGWSEEEALNITPKKKWVRK